MVAYLCEYVLGGTGTEVYYHTNGTSDDKKLAGIIAPKLAESLACRNRGVKYAKFTVLGCRATAVLVEGLFMDTVADYNKMIRSDYHKLYAKAIVDSIVIHLGLKKKVAPTAYQEGDLIKVKESATNYATGQTMASFVKGGSYEVMRTEGDKILLSGIVSWVWSKDVDKIEPPKPQFKEYKIKIICNTLNVREKANFDSKIVTSVKKGGVFTIVEELDGLGKLKSGVGWVSLNPTYVERV